MNKKTYFTPVASTMYLRIDHMFCLSTDTSADASWADELTFDDGTQDF